MVDALDVAQLAQPEIPLAIRLFAQTVATLSMILFGGAVLSYVVYADAAESVSLLDAMLPVLLIFGVLLTRVLQTVSDARRLAAAGFSPADVQRGLQAVVAERDQHRTELRADPLTQRARRRTLAWGAGLVVASAAMWRGAFAFRTTVRPGHHMASLRWAEHSHRGGDDHLRRRCRPRCAEPIPDADVRAPLSIGVAWAGWSCARAIGRPRRRARGCGRHGDGRRPSAPSVSERKADVAADRGVAADRVASLESRVTELEKWRSSAAARATPDTYQR